MMDEPMLTLTPIQITTQPVNVTTFDSNPDRDMADAADALLSLSGEADKTATTTTADESNVSDKTPVALEVNVIIANTTDSNTVHGNVIGTAIKEETLKQEREQENKPTTSKKSSITHFSMKSYRLKRKSEIKRRFKCRICPEILNSVRDYNYHHQDKHPPLPCPYCTKSFNAPRYLSRHLYKHAELMYECEKCGRGFTFESQYTAHKRRHIKDNDFVCMKVNCGRRFKRDSELKAHVKTHRKTNIKCGFTNCTYSNKDIRNVRAHRKRHSDNKPYKCANCEASFKWQEQKKWHLKSCK